MNASDLIFNNENNNGITGGGFSVKSIMMKSGLSPIMTLNNGDIQIGGMKNVSDIFNHLVVPNWAFSNSLIGGDKSNPYDHSDYDYNEDNIKSYNNEDEDEDEDEHEDEDEDSYSEDENETENDEVDDVKKGGKSNHGNNGDNVIHDDIHEKLLDLVRHYDNQKKKTRKNYVKKSNPNKINKKNTKKNKIKTIL